MCRIPILNGFLSILLFMLSFFPATAFATNVSFHVLDQHGEEILGSIIEVEAFGTLSTGDVVEIENGVYGCNIIPKMGSQAANKANLYRPEQFEITSDTQEIVLEWVRAEVTINLVDQRGIPIPKSTIDVHYITGTLPTPRTLKLPVTDESVYPSMQGRFRNGYTLFISPGMGMMQGYAWSLGRTVENVEISEETVALDYEWITSEVTFDLLDQEGNPIPKSMVEVHYITGHVATPFTIRLPITDESVYPTLQGSMKGGHKLFISPGMGMMQGYAWSLGRKIENIEISETSQRFEYEWIMSEVTFDVQDQEGNSLPKSAIEIHYVTGHMSTPFTIRLPITDESVYPTLQGSMKVGHKIFVSPGVLNRSGYVWDLGRKIENIEIYETTELLEYEWITNSCPM